MKYAGGDLESNTLGKPNTTFLEVELHCGTHFPTLRIRCLSQEVTEHSLLVVEDILKK